MAQLVNLGRRVFFWGGAVEGRCWSTFFTSASVIAYWINPVHFGSTSRVKVVGQIIKQFLHFAKILLGETRRGFGRVCLSVCPSPWVYRVQWADAWSCWVVEALVCSGHTTPPGPHFGVVPQQFLKRNFQSATLVFKVKYPGCDGDA